MNTDIVLNIPEGEQNSLLLLSAPQPGLHKRGREVNLSSGFMSLLFIKHLFRIDFWMWRRTGHCNPAVLYLIRCRNPVLERLLVFQKFIFVMVTVKVLEDVILKEEHVYLGKEIDESHSLT